MYDSFILPINHTTFLTLREVKRDFEGLRSLLGVEGCDSEALLQAVRFWRVGGNAIAFGGS